MGMDIQEWENKVHKISLIEKPLITTLTTMSFTTRPLCNNTNVCNNTNEGRRF
jgi:hypothetical protein